MGEQKTALSPRESAHNAPCGNRGEKEKTIVDKALKERKRDFQKGGGKIQSYAIPSSKKENPFIASTREKRGLLRKKIRTLILYKKRKNVYHKKETRKGQFEEKKAPRFLTRKGRERKGRQRATWWRSWKKPLADIEESRATSLSTTGGCEREGDGDSRKKSHRLSK